jgi:nucleoid-associated protein YgaU
LRVDELGAGGRVVRRAETPLQRAPIELGTLAGERTVVQPGNNLWQIARRSYGKGTQYSVIYDANRMQIRDPDLIYPGQIFVIPPDR